MAENLALTLAHRRVHAYADESDELIRRHAEAMECHDCEDFLKKGIDAFKWLRRAEETVREADYEGIRETTPEIQESLALLYAAWMTPCEFAERWISSLAMRGYTPGNVEKFRSACEEAEETLQRRSWQSRANAARALNSAEEEW
jgi:hypothetical protein